MCFLVIYTLTCAPLIDSCSVNVGRHFEICHLKAYLVLENEIVIFPSKDLAVITIFLGTNDY